jgi:hypothetical protein
MCAFMASVTPAKAALIGYYAFEGNALDSSGNGNHGTLSDVPPYFVSSGYEGGAYQFGANGDNTFITVPIDINPAALPAMTFGAWVNADVADPVIRGIISHDDGQFDRTLDVDVRGGGVEWCIFLGGSVSCDGAVEPGAWTFIVARYDATTGSVGLTVNDLHIDFTSRFPGPSIETLTTIGRNPNFDSPFIGRIDNVFFFDEFLTAAEIDNIRLNGISVMPVTEPGTLALLGLGLLAGMGLRRRSKT